MVFVQALLLAALMSSASTLKLLQAPSLHLQNEFAARDTEDAFSWKGKIPSDSIHDPEILKDEEFLRYIAGDQGSRRRGKQLRVENQSFSQFLDTCHSQDIDTIRIEKWMGRLGNRLWQIHRAVIMASRSGRKYVQLPTSDVYDGLFNFPQKRIVIEPTKLSASQKPECSFISNAPTYDCSFNWFQLCESTVKERKELYDTHLRSHLTILNKCEREAKDVVTIHVRNGDVNRKGFHGTCHEQPSCDYFHKVIDEGLDGHPFRLANIIASAQLPENHCIKELLSRKGQTQINVYNHGSVAEDYCALISASNLAVTTSSFSTTAKMMNSQLDRMFYPVTMTETACKTASYDLDASQVCEAFPMSRRFDNGKLSKCGDS